MLWLGIGRTLERTRRQEGQPKAGKSILEREEDRKTQLYIHEGIPRGIITRKGIACRDVPRIIDLIMILRAERM